MFVLFELPRINSVQRIPARYGGGGVICRSYVVGLILLPPALMLSLLRLFLYCTSCCCSSGCCSSAAAAAVLAHLQENLGFAGRIPALGCVGLLIALSLKRSRGRALELPAQKLFVGDAESRLSTFYHRSWSRF